MAIVIFIGYMGKSYIFSYLGENVTMKLRELTYNSILQKDIGWFDKQENQSSVLTSCLASEAALINGASSESLGPYTEAFFALFGGLIIGFYFCWQESLITLGFVPFMICGNMVAMEFEKGF
jgi:ABC-type multidrug transport system fused ATPase/permease subunit